MTESPVFSRVQDALAHLEADRDVRVLFACESGSRAWGFASRDTRSACPRAADHGWLCYRARRGLGQRRNASGALEQRNK